MIDRSPAALRALDREVADWMGDVATPDHPDDPESPVRWRSPDGAEVWTNDGGPARYSADIAAAMRAVERAAAMGHRLVLEDVRDVPAAPDVWGAMFDLADGHDTGHCPGSTPAEAICRAVLKLKRAGYAAPC